MTTGAAQSLVRPMTEQRQREAASEGSSAKPAFEELFLTHYKRIVSVLFRLLGNRSQAEELADDVFWKFYRQALRPEPGGNVCGWLYRTATNLGIDALRASARRSEYERAAGLRMLESAPHSNPLEDLIRQEKRSRVRAVLARLRPVQAQMLVLRACGFSYQELAEILGFKSGSVGTALIRAEAELRRRYLELYGKEEES